MKKLLLFSVLLALSVAFTSCDKTDLDARGRFPGIGYWQVTKEVRYDYYTGVTNTTYYDNVYLDITSSTMTTWWGNVEWLENYYYYPNRNEIVATDHEGYVWTYYIQSLSKWKLVTYVRDSGGYGIDRWDYSITRYCDWAE